MKKLLLVIDMQKSFINENTAFLIEKIQKQINNYDNVLFTRFINNKNSIFHKRLNYTGCFTEEERSIVLKTQNYKIINKSAYTALNEKLVEYVNDNNIDEIYLCGIDTECCILKTALDMFEKGYNVYVLKDYCACTHGKERHNNAIKILERNIGKSYII